MQILVVAQLAGATHSSFESMGERELEKSSLPSLMLAKTTYICIVKDEIVSLDFRSDQYFSFPSRFTQDILKMLGLESTEHPVPDHQLNANRLLDDDLFEIVEHCIERGLFCRDGFGGKKLELLKGSEQLREIGDNTIYMNKHSLGLRCIFTFIWSLLITTIILKVLPLSFAIARVRRRKRMFQSGHRSSVSSQLDALTDFRRIRPLGPSSKNKCLFNSHLLIEYLSFFNIYPHWTFAVRTKPFKAHCWVEQDGLLYDDAIEVAASYIPIAQV